MAQTALDLGYSPDQIAKIGNGSALTPSTTITASSLAPTPSVNFPPPPPVNTGLATNASIPSPIQDPASLVNQAFAPTQADKQQTDIMSRIAQATGSQTPLSTLQVQQQNAYGVPDAAKTLNSLQTQLQGLNDQATALQNEAAYTIPNQMQLSAQGRGVTEAGLAPLTASALRQNQIKQGAIATQALTVKAAYYAAQGNYAIAKEAADKAAQVAFDNSEQEIKGLKAQLDVLTPTLNKEEKGRAALLQVQLQDRQKQIDNQREDFKTGQAMAIAAMKFYADNPTVQFNAQQALKLDPSDPAYLQKVMGLVGQYQQDPLEIRAKNAQIDAALASTEKTRLEIEAARTPTGTQNSALGTQTAYKSLTAAQKTQADASNTILNSLQSYRELYDRLVKPSGSNIAGTDSAELASAYNSLIFQVAQAVGTGALQQADREVIEKIIPNPTSGIFAAPIGRMLKGGKAGGLQQIDSQISEYQSRLKNYGLEPTQLGNKLASEVAAKGYDYAAMKADGLSDEEIRSAIGK